MRPKAIVLLSGGLDSATALAIAHRAGFDTYAMSFRYGQRHAVEIECAERLARAAGVAAHRVVDIDLRAFGGSALTSEAAVPKDRASSGIPITYVPARNTIFLAYALAWAEVLGARHIYIGVNAVDYSGYPDCRPEFVSAFETMANLATKAGVEGTAVHITAPLINMTKAKIIEIGTKLGVNFSMTSSCYDPVDGLACGQCDSCRIRQDGFTAAGLPDVTRYAA